MGLRDCTGDDCAKQVESAISGQSIRWIEANLVGFWTLYTAGDEWGMDDLLIELGHGDVAEAMETAYAEAIDTTSTLEGRLDQLILNDRAAVEQLYSSIKGLTDLIKGDLATVLTLEIPQEASGDND